MNSRIVMPRQKEKHKRKKFFSRNTPPLFYIFYPEKSTKSIVRLPGERNAGKASTPGKNIEPQTGGEPLVCHN
jgi:hypothetical protein